jgi:hypothetical protein
MEIVGHRISLMAVDGNEKVTRDRNIDQKAGIDQKRRKTAYTYTTGPNVY